MGKNAGLPQPSGKAGSAAANQPSGPVTREAAPTDAVAPGVNDNVSSNVAKPTSVSAAAPNASASSRTFNISISGNKFAPDTVIVNLGDVFSINVTAVDRDYYFTQPDFGWNSLIKKGTTQRVGSGATASGKFTFYCSSCGGPDKGPVGYLIIANK